MPVENRVACLHCGEWLTSGDVVMQLCDGCYQAGHRGHRRDCAICEARMAEAAQVCGVDRTAELRALRDRLEDHLIDEQWRLAMEAEAAWKARHPTPEITPG